MQRRKGACCTLAPLWPALQASVFLSTPCKAPLPSAPFPCLQHRPRPGKFEGLNPEEAESLQRELSGVASPEWSALLFHKVRPCAWQANAIMPAGPCHHAWQALAIMHGSALASVHGSARTAASERALHNPDR